MEKNIRISMLLEIYGKLLTEKQFNVLDYYYNQDFGLSEIAENLEITRQAVRDNIQKAEKNLNEFEEKLHLMKKIEKIDKLDIDKNTKKEIRNILI